MILFLLLKNWVGHSHTRIQIKSCGSRLYLSEQCDISSLISKTQTKTRNKKQSLRANNNSELMHNHHNVFVFVPTLLHISVPSVFVMVFKCKILSRKQVFCLNRKYVYTKETTSTTYIFWLKYSETSYCFKETIKGFHHQIQPNRRERKCNGLSLKSTFA